MASGPITSWQIDGETVETVQTIFFFFFFGSKITADGDCTFTFPGDLPDPGIEPVSLKSPALAFG